MRNFITAWMCILAVGVATTATAEQTIEPEKWADYIEINARLAGTWPVITEKKDALEIADDWKDVEEKREHLSENPFAG